MSLDVPEQLLTPENSRSGDLESNNESTLADEKPTDGEKTNTGCTRIVATRRATRRHKQGARGLI